jgi:hypothetical protein
MTKTLFRIAATLTILATFAAAQSNFTFTKTETANVPFSFNVGDRTFPAGVYTVQLDHEKQVLVIRGEDRKALMLLANNEESKDAPKTSQLVFRRLGDHLFLKEAWVRGSNQGQSLPSGVYEKEIARRQNDVTQKITVQAQAR